MQNHPNQQKDNKNKIPLKKLLTISLAVTGILLLGYFLIVNFVPPKPPQNPITDSSVLESSTPSTPSSLVDDSSTQSGSEVSYPTDKLFVTKGRETYKDSQMILRVPRLELTANVLDGAEPKVLDRGVGLYDYAQLPGEGNRNVSMTAHRNKEFYYIDTITTGDKIYLEYDGIEYTYEYESTTIVQSDDWSIVYC
ncbi:MAG: class E sortase, partial [Oscillospiraceae bacterium]